jgi:hypothetical protein
MAAFKTLPTRRLGNGPLVPRLGLGLMGFRGTYGQSFLSQEEMLEFLDEAYKRGERFWDTGGFQTICKPGKTMLKLSQSRRVWRFRSRNRKMVCCKPWKA